MVQMKVANEILPAVVNNLYIPHGSDESDGDGEVKALQLLTLYPTWFR